MEDIYSVSVRITTLNEDLSDKREQLEKFVSSRKLPNALIAYEKQMELTTAQLRASGTPVSTIKDIAKGRCAEKGGELEQAKIEWRAILVLIEAIKAELNSNQSLFRHLENA